MTIHVTQADRDKWDAKLDSVGDDVIDHLNNDDIHVTADDKEKWNGLEERINKITSLGLSYKVLSKNETLPTPSAEFDAWVYLKKIE